MGFPSVIVRKAVALCQQCMSVYVFVGPPGGYGLPGEFGPDCKRLVAGPPGDQGCPGPDGEPGQSAIQI